MKIFLDKRCIINLCFLFLYLSSAFATATIVGKHRRLLIINSYNESAPWSQELITPILLQTSPIEDITADVVHMNGTFIRNDSLYIRMENGIFERFQDKKPDYLVLLGNMAFTLRERILSEWGNIPIVLIGNEDTYAPREYYFTGRPIHISNAITSPLVDLQPQYNFTFIETPYMYKETIDMMVQMLPKMKTIVFAADELYHNQDLDRLIHAYITSKYPNLHYERLIGNERNQNELQAYLLNDEPETGMLFSTWFYERKNLLGFPTLISGDFQLVASSPQPVFALRNAYVGKEGLREDISMTAWKCKTRFLQPSNRYLQERMHGISHLHIARNPIPSSTTSNCRWTVWTPHSVLKTRYSSINRLHSGRSINGGLFAE